MGKCIDQTVPKEILKAADEVRAYLQKCGYAQAVVHGQAGYNQS